MTAGRPAAAALLLALASGCAVGPNYVRPEIDAPAEYRSAVDPAEARSLADLPWWEVFDDPVLQQLVQTALEGNYDLATAVKNVEQARALVGVTQSQFYPQIQYQGVASRQREPFQQFGGAGSATFDLFEGAFAAAWELDVWGRIRRATEASRAQLFATEEFRRGVMLTLATSVAQAYLTLLELDRELEIQQEARKVYGETLVLFDQRFVGGVGSKLQVDRAEAALASAEAAIPDLERRIAIQENTIAVLLGRNPEDIPRGTPLAERPAPPPTPPGLPSQLLQRRPDIREAEENVIRANAEIGVAVANFFPRVGLTALYGGQAQEIGDVLSGQFTLWNLVGSTVGPLFQGFALVEQYRAQRAAWEATVSQYDQTVIQAFRDVSNALISQQKLVAVRAAQERQVRALRDSVRLSLLRYNYGLAGYYEVLDAEQQLFPAEVALAQTQRDQLLTVVDLYRSLGGGWELSDEQWLKRP